MIEDLMWASIDGALKELEVPVMKGGGAMEAFIALKWICLNMLDKMRFTDSFTIFLLYFVFEERDLQSWKNNCMQHRSSVWMQVMFV